MNNLKRILSLALAGVMTLGMMTVGASAAFDDASDINNIAAVETTNALGIIKGMDDNKFNPNDLVRRADAAIMIVRALNGGIVPDQGLALMYNGTFTDVKADDYFAEAVYYCYSMNIIAGIGDGMFDPAGSVTGYQLAKMILGALGYNASTSSAFEFTGSNWHVTVTKWANALKAGINEDDEDGYTISLFTGVKGKIANALTREDAAQMIYNGLQANTLDTSWNGSIDGNGNLTYSFSYNPSLLETVFDADTNYGILHSSTYNADKGTWDYTIGEDSYTSTVDASNLFLNYVQVITQGEDSTVIAISSVGGTVLTSGVVNDFEIKNDKLNNKSFSDELNNISVYNVNDDTSAVSTVKDFEVNADENAWYNYEAISYDGKTIDAIILYPTTIETVSDMKDGKITVGGNSYIYEVEDAKKASTIIATLVGDIAKNDYVIVSELGGKYTFTKIELTDDVQVTKLVGSTYTIGGKEYKLYNKTDNEAYVELGGVYNLVIVNKLVVDAKVAGQEPVDNTSALTNLLFVTEVGTPYATGYNGLNTTYTQGVRVYFMDGTSKIIEVSKLYDAESKKYVAIEADETVVSIDDTNFFTYKKNEDGTYNLTAVTVDSENKLDWKEIKTVDDNNTLTIGKGGVIDNGATVIADNAIFFVQYVKGEDTVYGYFTGAEINAWKGNAMINDDSFMLYNTEKTGEDKVGFGVITLVNDNSICGLPGVTADSANYGWVVSDVINDWDAANKKSVQKVDIWTGTKTVTYTLGEDLAADDFTKNTAIAYGANGTIITEVEETEFNAYRVTMNNGKGNIRLSNNFENVGTVYTLTDDTVVIYVNSKDGKGVESGSIAVAAKKGNKDDGYYYNANVYAVTNGEDAGDAIKVLFVDVNGALKGVDKIENKATE